MSELSEAIVEVLPSLKDGGMEIEDIVYALRPRYPDRWTSRPFKRKVLKELTRIMGQERIVIATRRQRCAG